MGHIAHLRKQFKSLNKYDYIITLIQGIKKKLYENLLVLHLNIEHTWIPFTQGCFVPKLVEIGPVVLEKKISKFRKCVFSLFHNYLALFSKTTGPISTKLGTKRPWVKGIYVCSNERPIAFQGEIITTFIKYFDEFKKSSSPEPLGQSQSNLAISIPGWRGFKIVCMGRSHLFTLRENNIIAKLH